MKCQQFQYKEVIAVTLATAFDARKRQPPQLPSMIHFLQPRSSACHRYAGTTSRAASPEQLICDCQPDIVTLRDIAWFRRYIAIRQSGPDVARPPGFELRTDR
jgi:hypothetical protein